VRDGAILARRYMNDRSPERYLSRVEETGLGEASFEEVDREQHLRERIFTGLRLSEGIDLRLLEEDLGAPIRSRFARVINRLVREELAVLEETRLRLTDRGLDLHSEVAVRFF
jgi:oxygen-independent coproporphyrinogen-3 oxidase